MYGTYGSSATTVKSNALSTNYSALPIDLNWIGPALIISFIIALFLFFVFLSKRNEGRFIGFAGWLYEFLSFKKLVIEGILKILYITFALFITIMSFTLISSDFWSFVTVLVAGNIGLRVGYEIMLVLLIVCKNTSEINDKLSK